MMAEIIGREDGYCRGRGGSMHITAIEQGMLGADAIVAGSSAIAVGAAHGLRLQGRDTVVICFFGDGAANQGILHEACNLAAVLEARSSSCARTTSGRSRRPRPPRRGSPTSPSVPPATASPASSSTATTSSRCSTVTADGRRARASGRRPDADRGEELPRSRRTRRRPRPTSARPRSSTRGVRAIRSSALAEARRGRGRPRRASRRSRMQARADVDEAVEFALASPRPEPEAATRGRLRAERLVTPAGRLVVTPSAS